MQTEKMTETKLKKDKNLSPNQKISKAMKLVNEAREQKMTESKKSIQSAIDEGRKTLEDYRVRVKDQFNTSLSTAETRVKENPLRAMLGAGIVGLILGVLFFGRRSRR